MMGVQLDVCINSSQISAHCCLKREIRTDSGLGVFKDEKMEVAMTPAGAADENSKPVWRLWDPTLTLVKTEDSVLEKGGKYWLRGDPEKLWLGNL